METRHFTQLLIKLLLLLLLIDVKINSKFYSEAKPVKTFGRTKVRLHAFLTSAVEVGE